MNTRVAISVFLFSLAGICAQKHVDSISMEQLGRSSYFLVNVGVGAYGVERFLVDTGATETVLADWYVHKMNIPQWRSGKTGTDAHGNKFSYHVAQIQGLTLGNKRTKIQNLPIVPSPAPFAQLQIAGILSPQSFFAGEPFMLNFVEKKLTYGSRLDSSKLIFLTSIVLRPCSSLKLNKFVVTGKINGISGGYYIDTGASETTLKKRYASEKMLKDAMPNPSIGVGSNEIALTATNIELSVNNLTQLHSIDIVENDACETSHGRIGNKFWMNYALLFDQQRRILKIFTKP